LVSYFLFSDSDVSRRDLYSFPTRRSSDLLQPWSSHSGRLRRWRRTVGCPCQRSPDSCFDCCTSGPYGHARCPLRSRGRQRRVARSEEHTSELQSRENLVCRLLLEKKKTVK